MSTIDAERKFGQATALYREKRFPEALQLLDELDSDRPLTKNIMFPRALCLAALGQNDEALQVCESLEALFQDNRAHELKARIEGAAKSVPGVDPVSRNVTRPTPVPRAAKKKDSRFSAAGVAVTIVLLGVGAMALFLFLRGRDVTPSSEFRERPKRAESTGAPSQQEQIDKAIRRHLGLETATDVEVIAEIRKRKHNF